MASLAEVEYPIHTKIDFLPVAQAREEAGACHFSQGGGAGMVRGPLGWLFQLLGGRETYMRAYPEPTPRLRERDLFAGVNVDR
ncbi:MAG: hypothetical protein HGB05_12180 [Chloroflexi bacterium]|nr:hypothetical protein [Chloroflexota bacterium]